MSSNLEQANKIVEENPHILQYKETIAKYNNAQLNGEVDSLYFELNRLTSLNEVFIKTNDQEGERLGTKVTTQNINKGKYKSEEQLNKELIYAYNAINYYECNIKLFICLSILINTRLSNKVKDLENAIKVVAENYKFFQNNHHAIVVIKAKLIEMKGLKQEIKEEKIEQGSSSLQPIKNNIDFMIEEIDEAYNFNQLDFMKLKEIVDGAIYKLNNIDQLSEFEKGIKYIHDITVTGEGEYDSNYIDNFSPEVKQFLLFIMTILDHYITKTSVEELKQDKDTQTDFSKVPKDIDIDKLRTFISKYPELKDIILSSAFINYFKIGNIKYEYIEQLKNMYSTNEVRTYMSPVQEKIKKFKPTKLSDYENLIPDTYAVTMRFH